MFLHVYKQVIYWDKALKCSDESISQTLGFFNMQAVSNSVNFNNNNNIIIITVVRVKFKNWRTDLNQLDRAGSLGGAR